MNFKLGLVGNLKFMTSRVMVMRAVAVYGVIGPLGVLLVDWIFFRFTGDLIDWGMAGFLLWPLSILGIGLRFSPSGIAVFIFLNVVVCIFLAWIILVLIEALYFGLGSVSRIPLSIRRNAARGKHGKI